MRLSKSSLSLVGAGAALVLAACQSSSDAGGTAAAPGPNPPGVEQPPAAEAAPGTESGGVVAGSSDAQWKAFGAAFSQTQAVKAADLLTNPAPYLGKDVLVEGTVVDVCQKAGCWLVLSDGSKQVRVTVKDHGFAVDKDCSGSWAQVEGHLREVQANAEEAAHMATEAQRPDLAPIAGERTLEIVASGVRIQKTADVAPAAAPAPTGQAG
jgi:hypothetical protein